MIDWVLTAGAYVYRPLKLTQERMKGWDVFALQTALTGIPGHADLDTDGIFGTHTKEAVTQFQAERDLDPVDGIAGIATQVAICQVLARQARKRYDLPNGCPYGHLEKESGCQLGNHTAPYPNGTRDCGVVQRNTQYATQRQAFDARGSVVELAATIEKHWKEYKSYGHVSNARAFELACGSWNAPAWTMTLAKGGQLSATNLAWIEGYMDRVTTYCDLSAL